MNGTGTQSDPYIVTSWNDLATSASISGAYIKFADNIIWNMNEIAPQGIETNIKIACKEINGNGATIHALYAKNTSVFELLNSSTDLNSTIKNLNITSLYLDNAILFDYAFSSTADGDLSVDNCNFTGKLYKSQFSNTYRSDVILNYCSLNIESRGKNSEYYPDFDISLINSRIKVMANNTYFCMSNLSNSKVIGNFKNSHIHGINGSAGLIDSELQNTQLTFTNQPDMPVLLNCDKISTGCTVSSYYTQITDSQMLDTSYLNSIGFPIGVD